MTTPTPAPGRPLHGNAGAPRLLAIGDIAWDVVVRPSGDLVWGSDVYGSTDLLPGGSSANVAVWARRLGAEVILVGKIGDDRLGHLMRGHLGAEGVASHVTMAEGAETTRVAIVIRTDGEHAFVTDHSNPLRLGAAELPLHLLDRTDVIFLNGYAVFMAGGAGFASELLDEARRRGIAVVFDPSSFALVRRYGAVRLLGELGPLDVLIGNEEELEALNGGSDLDRLLSRSRLVVVKQGGRGATARLRAADVLTLAGEDEQSDRPRDNAARYAAPALPVEVVDTTGAGDAFDAAFIVEYFTHGDIPRSLAAANLLGGRVAGCLGAQSASS